jgi:hypothetical protein
MADIVHSIETAAEPAAIYPLVSTGPGFGAWWAEDVVVMPDGRVELGFFRRATVYRLHAIRRETGEKVEWRCESGQEWGGTRLVFELKPRKTATLVRFEHAGWAAATEYFVSCNTTWGGLMFRLKAAAEGKSPGPLFLADGLAY